MYLTDIREENIRILMKGGSVLYIQYQSLRVIILRGQCYRCTVYMMDITYSVQVNCTKISTAWLIVCMYKNKIMYMYMYSHNSFFIHVHNLAM